MAIQNKSRTIRNRPRIDDRDSIHTKISLDIENSTASQQKAFTTKTANSIEIGAPILTCSEANGGRKRAVKRFGGTIYKTEHWSDKAKRHKKQKGLIRMMLTVARTRDFIRLPCKITLTRYATRKLDRFDNLPMSLKYILDAVCEVITGDYVPGRADSHEGLQVEYDQITSKQYFVKVKIENLTKSI